MLISTCEVTAESVPRMFADSGLIEILGTQAQAEVLRVNASDYAGLYAHGVAMEQSKERV
jgi:hypothetical protein